MNEPVIINNKLNPTENNYDLLRVNTGIELVRQLMRPKSWSPDNVFVSEIFGNTGIFYNILVFKIINKEKK